MTNKEKLETIDRLLGAAWWLNGLTPNDIYVVLYSMAVCRGVLLRDIAKQEGAENGQN